MNLKIDRKMDYHQFVITNSFMFSATKSPKMSTSNKTNKNKSGGTSKKNVGMKNKKSLMASRTISFPEPKRSSLKVIKY